MKTIEDQTRVKLSRRGILGACAVVPLATLLAGCEHVWLGVEEQQSEFDPFEHAKPIDRRKNPEDRIPDKGASDYLTKRQGGEGGGGGGCR